MCCFLWQINCCVASFCLFLCTLHPPLFSDFLIGDICINTSPASSSGRLVVACRVRVSRGVNLNHIIVVTSTIMIINHSLCGYCDGMVFTNIPISRLLGFCFNRFKARVTLATSERRTSNWAPGGLDATHLESHRCRRIL